MMSSEREVDTHSGIETTGHEWDGIKELDNPLPRWWLIIFYACIAAAVVMWVLFPAWPGINGYTRGILEKSDRADVAADLQQLHAGRGALARQLMSVPIDAVESDPTLSRYAMAAGEAAFGDNCATCHGAGGRGAKGYPTLADDVWLWGGTLGDIEHTIRVGIRSDSPDARFSQMPSFGKDGILRPAQIDDVTEYVLGLSGRQHNAAAAARGAETFATNCISCHGSDGAGMRTMGAPSLRDQVWLSGGAREDVRAQIWSGHGGVMPTWEKRLDPATIRALTIYVHSLGGGEATPIAAPAEPALAPPPTTPAPPKGPS
jgi:cytochrome c oxidase cbb3-type subunit III